MTISFFAAGDPKAKGSKHGYIVGGHVNVTEGKSSKSWEATVRAHVAGLEFERISGPVWVKLDFYLPLPKSRAPKPGSKDYWKRNPVPDGPPDIDKLIRAILDALNKVVFEDDARIIEIRATKQYSATKPGVQVEVMSLTPTNGGRDDTGD